MNNLELLRHSILNREPYIEDAYAKDALVISADPALPNDLMVANRSLTERITSYAAALAAGNAEMLDWSLAEIMYLLRTPGINHGEFTNFWGVFDVSYSSYADMTHADKSAFLKAILPRYIEHRHGLYQAHGYSASSLQVRCDSIAHKRSGQLGSRKVEAVLTAHGLTKVPVGSTLPEFLEGDGVYLLADSDGKALFRELLQAL